MEPFLAVAVGLLVAVAAYLMTDRHMVRMLFGIAVLGTAVNLVVFLSGDVIRGLPPLIPAGTFGPGEEVANALPQALVLTAIVIGFGLFAFALALVFKTAQRFGTADVNALGEAEGPVLADPPAAADEPSARVDTPTRDRERAA